MSDAASDRRLGRLVTALALTISVIVAVAIPVACFWSGYNREAARAHAQGHYVANQVSEIIARNPDLWRFEQARIVAVLVRHRNIGAPSYHKVLDASGSLVAEDLVEMAWPRFDVTDPVFDVGRAIAFVRTTMSLRDVVLETGFAAVGAILLALAAFITLRNLPLRAMDKALARAAHLASYDALTSLPNRALFHDRLRQADALALRQENSVAVLCLDLDQFKDVNDTLGHSVGDRLLVKVGAKLLAEVRQSDTVARLGGDEFAILQIGARQPSDAEALARRLVEVLSQPFDLDGHRVVIGASIGITIKEKPSGDPGRLLREADLALYKAKEEGRGTYSFFEASLNERLVERKRLEQDLRQALVHGQFRLHYQPLVEFRQSAEGATVSGAEALIRWHHPARGNVRPDVFIPLAEATGLIVPLGHWILDEACCQAATWPEALTVAVNVSPVQFRHAGFVEQVEAALQASGLAPARLQIEVTEGIMLTDTETTLAKLERLRILGVTLAMDDFGTGYSSLGYLRKFRFDKIKIDRSFVQHLGIDPDASAIVRAVVGMGRAMRIRINAEGVENKEQVEQLRIEGCDELQGYFFGKPMPSEEFGAALRPHHKRHLVGG